MANSMLSAIYYPLKYDIPFHDLGSCYYNDFDQEKKSTAIIKAIVQQRYPILSVKILHTANHNRGVGSLLKEGFYMLKGV